MTISVINVSGSSQQSAAMPSTRVRVITTAPVYYAVGTNPVAYSGNCEIIAANTKRDIIMGNINLKVAILGMGTAGNVSIASLGSVNQSAIV